MKDSGGAGKGRVAMESVAAEKEAKSWVVSVGIGEGWPRRSGGQEAAAALTLIRFTCASGYGKAGTHEAPILSTSIPRQPRLLHSQA